VKKQKLVTVEQYVTHHLGRPSMTYDRPKTYAQVRKMRRELAKHNIAVSCGRRYVYVSPLDWEGLIPRNFTSVADQIVFDNGGGCQ